MNDKSTFIAASLAFLAYGGWAFFSNYDDGITAATIAALIQGCATFTVTYISVKIIENLHSKFSGTSRLFLPVIMTFFFISGSIFIIHFTFNTPNILMSMAPSSFISIIFYIVWVAKLEGNNSRDITT
jgi:hypothetical protein